MSSKTYSNTVIYEVKCKNKRCKYVHIAGTTSFTKIKHYYKKSYYDNNPTKLNEEIKANGGWDNWNINILEYYNNCSSKTELNNRIKEWKKKKNTLLHPPKSTNKTADKNDYKCKHCMNTFSRSDALKRHVDSRCAVLNERKEADKVDQFTLIIEKQSKLIQELSSIIRNTK